MDQSFWRQYRCVYVSQCMGSHERVIPFKPFLALVVIKEL